MMTAVLIVFGSQSAALYRWVLGNRLMVFLGTISYGIYLPQFLLLAVLKLYLLPGSFELFAALCVLSVIVSYAAYRLIERPLHDFGVSLGKRVTLRRFQPS